MDFKSTCSQATNAGLEAANNFGKAVLQALLERREI
jgi:hypothetical protein